MNPIVANLRKYLIITFTVTYLCWGCLALLIHTDNLTFSHPFAAALHITGGFGPSIAALFSQNTKVTPKSIFAFLMGRKKKTARFLWIFVVLEILVIGLSSLERNPSVAPYMVPLIFLQAVLIYGGNEELGWRGCMQPLLEEKFPFPVATLITGLVWGVWHLPLWFVDGASQQSIPFVPFVLLGIVLSFFLAAVYKKTKSVFYCCVLHGLTNTLLSLFVIKVNIVLIAGLCIMLIYSVFLWYEEEKTG